MLKIIPTNQFKRDVQKIAKDKTKNLDELTLVINMLANGESLPYKYRDHKLRGDKSAFRECHIRPDWLLIYQIKTDILVLSLVRTGSHSEIL